MVAIVVAQPLLSQRKPRLSCLTITTMQFARTTGLPSSLHRWVYEAKVVAAALFPDSLSWYACKSCRSVSVSYGLSSKRMALNFSLKIATEVSRLIRRACHLVRNWKMTSCPEIRSERFPRLYWSLDRKGMVPPSGGRIFELQDGVRGPPFGTLNSVHGLPKELGIRNTEFPF